MQEVRKGRSAGTEELMREVSGLALGEKDPVKAYNRITEKLSERTRR
jgi:hypothetical protein